LGIATNIALLISQTIENFWLGSKAQYVTIDFWDNIGYKKLGGGSLKIK
jgi:hypothetical protein